VSIAHGHAADRARLLSSPVGRIRLKRETKTGLSVLFHSFTLFMLAYRPAQDDRGGGLLRSSV
jgi:hypothetical protein